MASIGTWIVIDGKRQFVRNIEMVVSLPDENGIITTTYTMKTERTKNT